MEKEFGSRAGNIRRCRGSGERAEEIHRHGPVELPYNSGMSDLTHPLDPPMAETLGFAREFLPAGARRVLEVGCGAGWLAARLRQDGLLVVAIDSSKEVAREAARCGVEVRHADWLTFEDEPFDAILFTRSLHHISPLEPAVARARRLLRPGGRVLVEDFAFDAANAATAEWLRGSTTLLACAGALDLEKSEFLKRLTLAADALRAWRAEHGEHHEIHSAANLAAALQRHFKPVMRREVPYLYRYLCAAALADERGTALVRAFLETERRLIAAGVILPLGRRFVGE